MIYSATWQEVSQQLPPRSGYYLGAWRRQPGQWVVSEVWFNTANAWWSASRGYFRQRVDPRQTLAVVAWMPLPGYEPPDEQGETAEQGVTVA